MTVSELRNILEEYDGEMEIISSEYENCRNNYYDIAKVELNIRKDEPRLCLILE